MVRGEWIPFSDVVVSRCRECLVPLATCGFGPSVITPPPSVSVKDSTKTSPVVMKMDPKGFYVYWTNQSKVGDVRRVGRVGGWVEEPEKRRRTVKQVGRLESFERKKKNLLIWQR